jgi:hypothetical protein
MSAVAMGAHDRRGNFGTGAVVPVACTRDGDPGRSGVAMGACARGGKSGTGTAIDVAARGAVASV